MAMETTHGNLILKRCKFTCDEGKNSDKFKLLLGEFNYVGFEVRTVMTMKNTTFWDVTPCNLAKVH
jgi:hypothetical protein